MHNYYHTCKKGVICVCAKAMMYIIWIITVMKYIYNLIKFLITV